MNILIVTVAGMSTRFSKSVGKETLKCIYYENDVKEAILSRLLSLNDKFDKYIIVGGYKFSELSKFVNEHLKGIIDKIDLVENSKYEEYGSGYSLHLGVKKALEYKFDSVVFAEGDIILDNYSFQKICESHKNVITHNKDLISADKSVVFYYNQNSEIKYIYDTNHGMLLIDEPFRQIYNSAQIWKMNNYDNVKQAYENISEIKWRGTNLVFIQEYFGNLTEDEIDNICIENWLNCNTIQDYLKGEFVI